MKYIAFGISYRKAKRYGLRWHSNFSISFALWPSDLVILDQHLCVVFRAKTKETAKTLVLISNFHILAKAEIDFLSVFQKILLREWNNKL